MRGALKSRLWIITLGVIALCGFLIYSLGELSLVQGGELAEMSVDSSTRTITLTGERGKILDSNGLPLAYNQKAYNVQFHRADTAKRSAVYRSLYTEIMQKTVDIVEAGGGRVIDTFPIYAQQDGGFAFYWGDISAEASAAREENWRKNMFSLNGRDANGKYKYDEKYIYDYLRRKFYIPEELDYDKARPLLSIWQEVQLSTYRSYLPVTVAYNVDMETVAEIESRSMELDGMQTAESNVRIYPKGQTAAHIVGYLGKMTESDDVDSLLTNGYVYDDLLGKEGIEKTMEEYLTANTGERRGQKTIETSKNGQVVRTLDTQSARDGYDVVLTIDLALQQVAENALAKNIEEINAEQHRRLIENADNYTGKIKNLDDIKLAKMGAAVVMDVKSGDVLALVNWPSYDANLFTGGLDAKTYEQFREDEALPLFNKAIASKAMPGSIFKMLTCIAALEEKITYQEYKGRDAQGNEIWENKGPLTVDTIISDKGPYTQFTQGKTEGAPRCWTRYYNKHSDENATKALTDSCNYYFYTLASGLGIDALVDWGEKFGLSTRTNIELDGEATGQIGGQKVLYDNSRELSEQKTPLARMVKNQLVSDIIPSICVDANIAATDAQINACAEGLIKLVDDNTAIRDNVLDVLSRELRIPKGVSNSNTDGLIAITSMLAELRWTPNQTIRTGIGQAVIQVTPIAVARYVSALLNGGNVYDAHIVKRVIDEDGETILEKEPVLHAKLDLAPENVKAIKEGLRGVVSPEDGGTASEHFQGFEYLDQLGGKTGTAQISQAQNNIDLQNTSWFTAFAPYDDPEIAVVVYIPNGLSGSSSASTVREIVKFYLDRKTAVAEDNLPAVNSVVQ